MDTANFYREPDRRQNKGEKWLLNRAMIRGQVTVAAEIMRLMPQIEERVGNAIRDDVRRRGGPEAAFG